MRPVNRLLPTALGVVALAFIAKNTWADGGARTSGGHGTPEDLVSVRVEGAQLDEDYATFHAPDPGLLRMLTFDVNAAGAGAGAMRLGVVRHLSDGGVESLCDVNIPCTTPPKTHIHPDAGTCGDATVQAGEHLKVSPIEGTCGNYPDGMLVATFLWE